MEELGIRVGPKPVSPKAKKSSTKGRHGEDLEYIPEPRICRQRWGYIFPTIECS